MRLSGGESRIDPDTASRIDDGQDGDGSRYRSEQTADQFDDILCRGIRLENGTGFVVVHHVAGVTAGDGDDRGDKKRVRSADIDGDAYGEKDDDAEYFHRVDSRLPRDERRHHRSEKDTAHEKNRRQDFQSDQNGDDKSDGDKEE